jgi:hypothetical protein
MAMRPGESMGLRESEAGAAGDAESTGHTRADGAMVSAILRGAVATDEGQTAAFLCLQAGARRLPLRARRTIEGICRMNDAEFERGAVIVRLAYPSARDRRDALDRLGRICARISRLKIAAGTA